MIVFRADANETAATGHLMRCMTIAEACREKAWNVNSGLQKTKRPNDSGRQDFLTGS